MHLVIVELVEEDQGTFSNSRGCRDQIFTLKQSRGIETFI